MCKVGTILTDYEPTVTILPTQPTGTCNAVFWMGVVRVVIPVGLCIVDNTCAPSALSVVRTSESVLRI